MLARLRARRGFDARVYLEAKALLLNQYATRHGLRAAVVGVSGGVDSAVTLALVRYAAELPGAPWDRVVGVLAPMFDTNGATGQGEATARGREVIAACGAELVEVDLTKPLDAMLTATHAGARYSGGAWATGQMVSYLRTPAFYHLTALLTEQGFPAVLLGTTNRDEGAYIGFFGKASDGMADIQPISDLHKSEVYALADILPVPESVRRAPPTGDTFDGRTDEQMIGVLYDGIELAALDTTGHPLDGMRALLDDRHERNAHKYLGASPAIHFDVYERGVPGGWPVKLFVDPPAPPATVDVSHIELTDETQAEAHSIADFGDSAFTVRGLLTATECARLETAFDTAVHVETGPDGRIETAANGCGSERASAFAPSIAAALWECLRASLPAVRVTDAFTPTDCEGPGVWRAIGINPFLRFMAYGIGSRLVPHYDSTFDYGDGRRTLMSVVIYLSDGGSPTRLLLERQRHLPVAERDFFDAAAEADTRDVLAEVAAVAGGALVIDHRVPHDVPATRQRRLILRTDVVYVRSGAGDETQARRPARAVEATMPAKIDPPWGVKRDPYYRSAFEALGSMAALERTGYFDDGRPAETTDRRFDPRWMTTPLDKLLARLVAAPADEPLVVLLTTGGFYPVHLGHTAMMNRAREALECRGYHVLAGYLSPGHDDYLRSKSTDAPGASERLRLAAHAVRASDWLELDPWEAMHTGRPVNFTEVTRRLEAYLAHHVRCHRRIAVAYVYGSDNARFSAAFAARGLGVCVPRPGYERELAEAKAHPLVRHNNRIVFAAEGSPRASSREARSGDYDALDDATRAAWVETRPRSPAQTAPVASHGRAASSLRPLTIRDESDWPIKHWIEQCPRAPEALRVFRDGLISALTDAFAGEPVRIATACITDQIKRAAALIDSTRVTDAKVLSLDPCVPGDVNLGVSRCYGLASSTRPPVIMARPGWPRLGAQIAALPQGSFVLLDDDTATGETLRAVHALLPDRIERVVTLSAVDDRYGVLDLVDSRDFLAGARDAGLVVSLPSGDIARAPYLLPYVSPSDRCSVPPAAELALSCAVWELNLDFFEALTGLTVGDCAPAFRALCAYLGFADPTPMTELCRWHIERLAGPFF